jgi:uncharacterized membrane protein YfcA
LITLFNFSLSWPDVLAIALVALLIGMSKTGVHGTGMVAVPILASVFGGQLSSSVMLPIICLADIMGVWYYHRHAEWHHLKKLFPWAIVGTVLGTAVGGSIDDHVFKIIMAGTIIISVGIMIWLERGHKEDIPDYWWFAALTGIIAGFASMVGNLAGAVMSLYFLSMRMPKNSFIGTAAWYFMVINWLKVPFHIWAWHTITLDTFLLDLTTLPIIILGAFLGVVIVRNLKEKTYRWFIIAMTLLAAIIMLLKK